MKKILSDNWNRGNTDQRTPVIEDITTVEAGRGKRLDLTSKDAILLYETVHNEEQPEVFYDLDKATLRPESKKAMDGLIKTLDENPTIVIKMIANTGIPESVFLGELFS